MHDFGEFAAREKKGWADDGIVSAYVEKFGPVTDHVARYLVSRVQPQGKAVLDLCCGQGTLTAMLGEAGAEVTGLDFSEEMLALAAKNAPKARLQQGDACALPFDDASFDFVICNFGIMHLPDQEAALSEIERVLTPQGRFVMATWAAPEVSPAFAAVLGAIKTNADFSQAPDQPDLFLFARPDGAKTMMQTARMQLASHDLVQASWTLTEPEELFEIFLTATVAASQLIKDQRPETIRAIQGQITNTVRDQFCDANAYRIPVSVAVAEAVKRR